MRQNKHRTRWQSFEDGDLAYFARTGCTAAGAGKALHRTTRGVKKRAARLGIRFSERVIKLWTAEEDFYLKVAHRDYTARQIGVKMHRTKNSVLGRISRLHLR